MEDNFDDNFSDSQHERRKKKAALSAATLTPFDEGWVAIGDIEYLTAESLAILKQRGQEWYDIWPQGEPYINGDGEKIKIKIYVNQVAGLLKTDMHIAKNVLIVAAKVLGINTGEAVTIKQCCHLFNLKEEEIRPVIQNIPPELSEMEAIFNTPEARAQAEKSKKKALESIAKLKPSEEPYIVINGLPYLTAEGIEMLKQRAMEWFDENPLGEPMYARNDKYQFVIHTNQVAELFGCGIRKAQLILEDNRQALGKKKTDYVSVKEFCKENNQDEEDVRRALSDIPPDFSIE